MPARSRSVPGEGSRGRPGTVPPARPLGPASLLATAVLFLGLLALFRVLRQESYWGDGRFLVFWLENGRWGFYHLAYLPAAEILHHTLGSLFGWDAAGSLHFLSAASGAAAASFLFLACLLAGRRGTSSAAAVLLLVSAPAVWFYSTSIEIHALQLMASAAAVLWAASAWSRGRLGSHPVAPSLVLAGVSTSHLTGITWTPAVAFLAWAGRRGESRARRLGGAAAAVIVCAVVYLGATRFPLAVSLLDRAGRSVGSPLYLGSVVREFLTPAIGIVLLTLVVLVDQVRTDPRSLRSTPAVATILLALALVPFAFVIDIAERGAYFISLLPVFAFWIARWIDHRSGRLAWTLVVAMLALQAWITWREVREWEEVSLPEWVEALHAETGDETVLFTMDRPAAQAAFRHTGMIAFSVVPGRAELDLANPQLHDRALGVVQKRAAEGYRVAITRDMLETDHAETRSFVAEVTARLGQPAPGADPFYLLFPPSRLSHAPE